MLTFLDFVLLITLLLLLMIVIFLFTGVIYNQEGYVSIIEKRRQFYKIETSRLTFAFPVLFRKVGYYPVKPSEYKISGEKYLIYVEDPIFLYQHNINLKKLIKENKNLEVAFKNYRIFITKK